MDAKYSEIHFEQIVNPSNKDNTGIVSGMDHAGCCDYGLIRWTDTFIRQHRQVSMWRDGTTANTWSGPPVDAPKEVAGQTSKNHILIVLLDVPLIEPSSIVDKESQPLLMHKTPSNDAKFENPGSLS